MDAVSRTGSRDSRHTPATSSHPRHTPATSSYPRHTPATSSYPRHTPATSSHARPAISGTTAPAQERNEALPDLLNSHVLPPYTRPRPNQRRFRQRNNHQSRGQHSSRRNSSEPQLTDLDVNNDGCCSKETCTSCITMTTRFKWILVGLAVLGIVCVVTGIVLGALHMSVGSSFLTLSLMFIGLGVMLVIVVGIGWRCTPTGHEPCHLLFGIGNHTGTSRRSRGSTRSNNDRNQWLGGVLYPEFRYRRPPPSYNASMQEYQQQLVIAQLQPSGGGQGDYSLPSSPPPTYRSRASTIRTGLHITFPPQSGGDYPSSGPPTYRSRAGDTMERPSLLLDNASINTRIARIAQSEDLTPFSGTPFSGTPSCMSQGTPSEVPGLSESSTLYRVQQAVQYLDNVIETQREEARMMRSRTSSSVSRGVQVTPTEGMNSQDMTASASRSEHISAAPSEHARASQSEHAIASPSEHARASQSEHASASQSEHASASQSEHASASQSELASASQSEHASASQSELTSASQSEHASTSLSEHASASQSKHARASQSEHAIASQSEHASASPSEHARASQSEHASVSQSEHASVSQSEHASASQSELASASQSEHASASQSEHARASLSEHASTSLSEHASTSQSEPRITTQSSHINTSQAVEVITQHSEQIQNATNNPAEITSRKHTQSQQVALSVSDICMVEDGTRDHTTSTSHRRHTVHSRQTKSLPEGAGGQSSSQDRHSRHNRHSSAAEGRKKGKTNSKKSTQRLHSTS